MNIIGGSSMQFRGSIVTRQCWNYVDGGGKSGVIS